MINYSQISIEAKIVQTKKVDKIFKNIGGLNEMERVEVTLDSVEMGVKHHMDMKFFTQFPPLYHVVKVS